MIPVTATLPPFAAANASLYFAAATPVSGTALVLTGTKPDIARRVLATYGNELAARTLALTGTDRTGQVITETLQIPAGAPGTVGSIQDFATLTGAVPGGGGWSANLTLGTSAVASTDWKPIDHFTSPVSIGFSIEFAAGAAGTVGIEYTYLEMNAPDPSNASAPINALIAPPAVPVVYLHPTLKSISSNTDSNTSPWTFPATNWRLTSSARITGGNVVTRAVQAGQNI